MAFLETVLGRWLMTAGIAMVPVIELRGAIPIGVAAGLAPWEAYLAAVIGNLLPVPLIMLLVRQVFDWLRGGKWWGPKIEKLEARAHLKGKVIKKYRLPGLILLVAIPLPGTGAWTGALAATLLDIRMRDAMPAILAGLLIAGGITLGVTCGAFAMFG
ncbi:MAG: small multi-drug export protein [Oscillibacter sp.]|nr:small multi-drug export protein [Oscillibacter sp.]